MDKCDTQDGCRFDDVCDELRYIDDSDTDTDNRNIKTSDTNRKCDSDRYSSSDSDNDRDSSSDSDNDSYTDTNTRKGKIRYKKRKRGNGKSSDSDSDSDSGSESGDDSDSHSDTNNKDKHEGFDAKATDGHTSNHEQTAQVQNPCTGQNSDHACNCQDTEHGDIGNVTDSSSNDGSDFKVKLYKRQNSWLVTSPVDPDGDMIIDPFGKTMACQCWVSPDIAKQNGIVEPNDVGEVDNTDRPSVSSESDDDSELVESKKGQLYICGHSSFCRIDSRTSTHEGKQLIRHYVTKETETTDIIGNIGLKPLDELLKVNGKSLKNLEQKKVKRIFKKIKLNKKTCQVKLQLHIRRWFRSTEEGAMHEQNWASVKEILIKLVLVPGDYMGDTRVPPNTSTSRWKKIVEKAQSFSVKTSNAIIRNDKDLNVGCINVERLGDVKKYTIRCDAQGRFISNEALGNNFVGLSPITNHISCVFYAEFFSGSDLSPKSPFINYLFCVRFRVKRSDRIEFLTSNIKDGTENLIFRGGRDDFESIKREQNVDERCFIVRSIGSSDLYQSLIYRDRFMAYNDDTGHVYMKQVPTRLQEAFVAGQENAASRTELYARAAAELKVCWFTRNEAEVHIHKRIGKMFRSLMCGVRR